MKQWCHAQMFLASYFLANWFLSKHIKHAETDMIFQSNYNCKLPWKLNWFAENFENCCCPEIDLTFGLTQEDCPSNCLCQHGGQPAKENQETRCSQQHQHQQHPWRFRFSRIFEQQSLRKLMWAKLDVVVIWWRQNGLWVWNWISHEPLFWTHLDIEIV